MPDPYSAVDFRATSRWQNACSEHAMRTLWADVRYGLRGMRQAPGFHLLVLTILALGIAASVSVFSLVDGVVLRPLPYREASRLVALSAVAVKPPFYSNGSVTYQDFERFQERAQ